MAEDHPILSCDCSGPSTAAINLPQSLPKFLNGGYWPCSRFYTGGYPSDIPINNLTHVHYAFADIADDGTVYFLDTQLHCDYEVDGTSGCIKAWTKRKEHAPHLKVTLAVSGGRTGVAQRFAQTCSTRQTCFRFVQSVQSIIEKYQLDGVDIDWEYPVGPIESENYAYLLDELRKILGWNKWITTVLSADKSFLSHLNLARISSAVDFVNLKAYNFVGPDLANVRRTGHQAQLYLRSVTSTRGNAQCGAGAVEYLLDHGVLSQKIMLGIPVFGRTFKGASAPNQGFSGPGSGQDATHEVKDLPLLGMDEVVDANAVAAYATGNGEFITYDNRESVGRKAEYVKRNNLRGLFYWHLAGDRRGTRSLVSEGYRVLVGEPNTGTACDRCQGAPSQPSASNTPE